MGGVLRACGPGGPTKDDPEIQRCSNEQGNEDISKKGCVPPGRLAEAPGLLPPGPLSDASVKVVRLMR